MKRGKHGEWISWHTWYDGADRVAEYVELSAPYRKESAAAEFQESILDTVDTVINTYNPFGFGSKIPVHLD